MKICDISALYYPHGGGIKTYIDNKRLVYKQRNIPHILLAPNVENMDKIEKVTDGSLTLYYLPSRKISFTGTPYYVFKDFNDIKKVLTAESPDIIEIGDKMTTFFFKKKIQKLHQDLNVKIFAFSHERADNFSKTVIGNKFMGSLLASMVMKRFVDAVDYVITNSEFTAEEIRHRTTADKIFVVYLGIDSSGLNREKYFNQDLRDKLSENGNKHLLIHVGRLDKDKRIGLLVQIAKKLDANRYKLVIVGGGSHEKLIKDLPAVEFIGYVKYEEVKKYLAVCDLGILINDIEPYGLVGLEMMAMELPVLGPNKGGLPSFLRKEFAWLLPHHAEDYLQALEEWSSLPVEIKKQKSQLARKEVSKYTLDTMVDQLLAIYQK